MTEQQAHNPAMGPQGGAVPMASPPTRTCQVCQNQVGLAVACQFCGQVYGLPAGVKLSSVGKRFGAYLLDVVLSFVTLFIGWLIWSLIVWGRGQTPAKQLLNMRVVKTDTGKSAGWGTMFVRELPAKFVIGIAAVFTLYVIYFWLAWDKDNQELWDKMVSTIVVEDPQGLLDPTSPQGMATAGSLTPASIPQPVAEAPESVGEPATSEAAGEAPAQ